MIKIIGLFIMLITVVMSMSSCKNVSERSKSESEYVEPMGTYEVMSEDEYNYILESSKPTFINQDNFVDDAYTAQLIGDAVIRSIVGEEEFGCLIEISVLYNKQNCLWLINRGKPYTLGGGFTCIISRINGEILKVWAGT